MHTSLVIYHLGGLRQIGKVVHMNNHDLQRTNKIVINIGRLYVDFSRIQEVKRHANYKQKENK